MDGGPNRSLSRVFKVLRCRQTDCRTKRPLATMLSLIDESTFSLDAPLCLQILNLLSLLLNFIIFMIQGAFLSMKNWVFTSGNLSNNCSRIYPHFRKGYNTLSGRYTEGFRNFLLEISVPFYLPPGILA